MLTTGFQLVAARALIGWEQTMVAERAGFSVTTIRNMEKAGAGPIAGRSANVQAVQRALEAAGIEFLNHGQPGVRLRDPVLLRQGKGDATAADMREGAAMARRNMPATDRGADQNERTASSLERSADAMDEPEA